MDLKKTLETVNKALSDGGVEFALIGGMALATLGIHRATYDIDFLMDENDKEKCKKLMAGVNFKLEFESQEVLHFSGIGKVDILLARRPLSKKMLEVAERSPIHHIKCLLPEDIVGLKVQAFVNDPSRELQDKADIQSLFKMYPQMNWQKVKMYADLFGKWDDISKLK